VPLPGKIKIFLSRGKRENKKRGVNFIKGTHHPLWGKKRKIIWGLSPEKRPPGCDPEHPPNLAPKF